MTTREYPEKANKRIEIIKGMRDVLPEEYERRSAVLAQMERVLRSYGYSGIQVPIMEKAELQLRKSGEGMRRAMFFIRTQNDEEGGEEPSLRPELTASIARAFNAEMQSRPLPIRLYYIGSAFRHDQPQKGRLREFTQIGVELVGDGDPAADAEIIVLARDIIEALGIRNYKILIGNIGVLLACLKSRQLQEITRVKILEKLEDVGKAINREKKLNELEEYLLDARNESEAELSGTGGNIDKELIGALKKIQNIHLEDEVKIIAGWMLGSSFDNRVGQDYQIMAERLMKKIEAKQERQRIPEVISFMKKLVQIKGQPPAVFTAVEDLLKSYGLPIEPVDRLKAMTRYLDMYGVDWSKAEIDFGFGRGLAYYTGMVFEIHDESDSLGAQKQICGGGRYDELVGELGGKQNIPALGFAFGLERLLLLKETNVSLRKTTPSVFLIPIGDGKEIEYAIASASRLREMGVEVEFCSPDRKPGKHTERANKLGVPYVIYIGEDEKLKDFVTIKNMSRNEQKQCSIEDAASTVLGRGEE